MPYNINWTWNRTNNFFHFCSAKSTLWPSGQRCDAALKNARWRGTRDAERQIEENVAGWMQPVDSAWISSDGKTVTISVRLSLWTVGQALSVEQEGTQRVANVRKFARGGAARRSGGGGKRLSRNLFQRWRILFRSFSFPSSRALYTLSFLFLRTFYLFFFQFYSLSSFLFLFLSALYLKERKGGMQSLSVFRCKPRRLYTFP